MGGPGSGDWYRWDKKDHVRSRPYIDIRYLKQHGQLTPGALFNLDWEAKDGDGHASADCRCEADRLVVDYEIDSSGENREIFQSVIEFDFTPCHFGGKRTWLICPKCNKRVAVVYISQLGFSCRQCCDLTYLSRSLNRYDRLMLKAKLIHVRLGCNGDITGPLPPKPKGMHWETYWWLLRQEAQLLQPIWDRLYEQLNS
jgi:hypothetical protein